MNDANPRPTVFLCHASEDKESVRDLSRRLRHSGIDPWLDEEQLLPGQDWEQAIRNAVRATRTVVVCLSRRSLSKEGFVQKEIKCALDVADEKPEGTIYIVPARLEPCEVPARLKQWHWVDLFDFRGFDRLLRTLELNAKGGAAADSARKPATCALVSDGTPYSIELMDLAQDAGFIARSFIGAILPETPAAFGRDFGASDLMILVRGEHFEAHGNLEFYKSLKAFVGRGGFLLATPWVSWETHRTQLLSDMLPFDHPDARFREDAFIEIPDVDTGKAVKFHTSFEELGVERPGATALLTSKSGIPVMGVRDYLSGCCLYLNVCQHSCKTEMDSPFVRNPGLRRLVGRTLIDMHSEIHNRRLAPSRRVVASETTELESLNGASHDVHSRSDLLDFSLPEVRQKNRSFQSGFISGD